MSAFESEYNPFAELEAEEVLRKSREGAIQLAYGRLDEAMMREAEEEAIYFWHDDAEATDSDILAVMLTRDGEYPFLDELDQKEQIILRFSGESLESITIEHVRDGDRNTFLLSADELRLVEEDQEVPVSPEIDPSDEDVQLLVQHPEVPVSDIGRISNLREKLERFQLTKRP